MNLTLATRCVTRGVIPNLSSFKEIGKVKFKTENTEL